LGEQNLPPTIGGRTPRPLARAVAWNDAYPFAAPVGQFKANPWQLHDMHGNVGQWCSDRYGSYQEGFQKDPKGSEKGESRVLRGGSWVSAPQDVRSAVRFVFASGYRGYDVGFRVVTPATTTP
jgi:formylglycine-generating enzyme required for sulfatase activity